jgi:hypothetical protein
LQTELFRDFGAESCKGLETHGELCLCLLLLVVDDIDDEMRMIGSSSMPSRALPQRRQSV